MSANELTIDMQDRKLSIENRIKNLMWTVSGDYGLDVKFDPAVFEKSKYIALYDAIKEGAFAKYFNKETLSFYIVKKIYLSGEEKPLIQLAQLCVDAASYPKISTERMGVEQIRQKAFLDMLDLELENLANTAVGQIKATLMKAFLSPGYQSTERINRSVKAICDLGQATDTMEIIRTIDRLYNTVVDKQFEKKYGDLERVLSVTLEELTEFDWHDFLEEESYEDVLKQYMNSVSESVTHISQLEKREEKRESTSDRQATVVVDEEAIKRMYSYVELNHGKSYLTPLEQERINYTLCKGVHHDCSLYFTDGILHNPVKTNYQYKYAAKQLDKNRNMYYKNHRIVKRNILLLTDALRKALIMRNENDYIKSDSGQLLPASLWKVGRVDDNKLFQKLVKKDNADFVVDILIDSSGSQSSRQADVAMQAYIISEALSTIYIPHRVMGFCTFWDYTILRRFREYDDPRSMNTRIFEYAASSNNRDGLAIKAAAHSLLNRTEDNKILIVLSDGRPNDQILNRPSGKNPQPYYGEFAIKDTAFEVRRTRSYGISVLGVFAGKEEDLAAEKRIFGKDFAYIRTIENFSNVVGMYLKKQLNDE